MSTDVYSAPESELLEQKENIESASRWARLGASILDGILMALLVLGFYYIIGVFDYASLANQGSEFNDMDTWTWLAMTLFPILIFAAVNLYTLINTGQTLGKVIVGIRIVTLENEYIRMSHILKRYGVSLGVQYIPVLGGLLSLLNILMIFGKQKRCGHDLVAGTRVIDC